MSEARAIELLAPARDALTAIEAIKHGADAVYIGAPSHGARAAAMNSIKEIATATEYAHKFHARVYATVNTIIYDDELLHVERMIRELYRASVDAIIVQDLGILRLDIPPIELHASTQCDIRTAEQAQWLESLGFSQLVLARELSLDEITHICQKVKSHVECFIHGALCVCYSGRCIASQVLRQRSANRGECAQICRLPFDLTDESGHTLIKGKHLLSLHDLNQTDRLQDLLNAGVTSLKIEGRLKDTGYVKNIVAHYRQQLDRIISSSQGAYTKASSGTSVHDFTPNPFKSFNRGFTHYFLDSRHPTQKMASLNTPRSTGEPAGKILSSSVKLITVSTALHLHNGDGMAFFDSKSGEYRGFRANRVEKIGYNMWRLWSASPVAIPPKTLIYRTNDSEHDIRMNRQSATRKVNIKAFLRYNGHGILSLEFIDEQGISATASIPANVEPANTPQTQKQTSIIGSLGDTIYRLESAKTLDDFFVPASTLSHLRRDAIEILNCARSARRKCLYRKPEIPESTVPYTCNVANKLAESVYREHGANKIVIAAEISESEATGTSLMRTRYCIRRELGACLKTPDGSKLPKNLKLTHGDIHLNLLFDCSQCEMSVQIEKA